MSKNKKKNIPIEESKDASEFYKINKDAVSRLVNASKESVPKVSDEEINRISGKKSKFHIPDIIKVVLIKWWFAGAVCFFFLFGLGTVIKQNVDLLFITGFALGMVTDLLTNNVLKHFEPYDRAWDKYMFITVRKFWSLFLNIIYNGVVFYGVVYLYGVVNRIINIIQNTDGELPLGVEPLMFGVFVLLIDMLFIFIRNTFIKILKDAKAANRR